jgi:hypothetical protein
MEPAGMTEQQLELTERPKDPIARKNAKRLTAFLVREKVWRTLAYLGRRLYMNMRELRAARKASKGAVIYGQKGFRASRTATIDERLQCASEMRSRAIEFDEGATDVLRWHHRYGRDAE